MKIVLSIVFVLTLVVIAVAMVVSLRKRSLRNRHLEEILRQLQSHQGTMCRTKLLEYVRYKHSKLTDPEFSEMLQDLVTRNYVASGDGILYSITTLGEAALEYVDRGESAYVFKPIRVEDAPTTTW